VAYPSVTSVSPSVVPGDGTAHLGLVLNIFDPLPCTKGYEATPRRAGNEVADTPVNAQAHCAEPYLSPIDVRGAQNVPQPGGGHGDPAVGGAGGGDTGGTAHREPPPARLSVPLPTGPLPLSTLAQILMP